ncbi:MAG: UDP-N-acetylmuramate--L-alanine ligase [Candidatus Omnitrophica bacterium CG_4_9_14_0_2_um_filter_43_12]|nr:MAG: UDP-N-acetylmuramate--L-alanine ligase [Candidatus Omnitrophica bacterium CG_4_9_14_0_2_um_filter_43_12]
MKYLNAKKHIFFIAIGGIGMSAIALVLLKKGFKISGSDIKPNSLTEKLAESGAGIYFSHKAGNLKPDVDLVIYSSCINNANPEMLEAKSRGIKTVSRGTMLAELVAEKKGIAVCGCHGKTTTSGMIATLLREAGLDPTALIGGEVNYFGSNACFGRGDYLVTEADESDGSFLKLKPFYSVLTNIDEDHMDYFKDKSTLVRRFAQYVSNIKKGGSLIYSCDDPRLVLLKKYSCADNISYGFTGSACVRAKNITAKGYDSSFDCYYKKDFMGRFKIRVPGGHNVSNALAAVCVGVKLGLGAAEIKSGLLSFTGTKRRFQVHGCFSGVTVVEDYAHHPAEIVATLKAARHFKPKRVIGVFQPHRFTRTLYLADRFAGCFNLSNYLILTDIYSASENAIKGITGRVLYDKVKKFGHKHVVYIEKNRIADHICRIKKPGDMVIVLGAGDINEIAQELARKIR